MSILSSENEKIKEVRGLLNRSQARRKSDCCVLENKKDIDDFIKLRSDTVKYVLVCEGFLPPDFSGDVYIVDQKLYRSLYQLPSLQPWLAVVKKDWGSISDFNHLQKVFILDGVQDPANVGAIIRSAAAFSFDAVLLHQSADPYQPKSLRAMAGALSLISLISCTLLELVDLKTQGMVFVACSLQADDVVLMSDEVFDRTGIILGSEGQGVSEELCEMLKPRLVKIPINNKLDSLNVAVTAGIMGYYLRSK